MFINEDVRQLFHEHLELADLHIDELENTFSNTNEFRTGIRQALVSFLKHSNKNIEEAELDAMLNLDLVPQSIDYSISISHCPSHGVFCLSQSCRSLGIDIEEIERVAKTTIARMSSDKEMQQCPSPAHLWAAKESSFKSFYQFNQPSTASEVEISDWREKKNNFFSFNYKLKDSSSLAASGSGFCGPLERLIMSISKI